MTRLIKRYGSRKLYDTLESRYILLEDIAEWIRDGDEISVVDNKTGEDVTALTLTQVISEQSRKTSSFLPNDLLHDLIRAGETSVKRIQMSMENLVQKGIGKLVPISSAREEMNNLRQRLDELEVAVNQAETSVVVTEEPAPAKKKTPGRPRKAPAKKVAPGKTAEPKMEAKAPAKTTPKKTTARKAVPKSAPEKE